MAIDLTKPFKMGAVMHKGLVPRGDPMFSGGPMISGRRMAEWLESSPKKTEAPTNSAPSSPTPDSSEE